MTRRKHARMTRRKHARMTAKIRNAGNDGKIP
jgi:hypothetical protein